MENKKITLTYPPGLTFSEMVDFFTGEFLGNKSIVDFVKNDQYEEFVKFICDNYNLLGASNGGDLDAIDEMIFKSIFSKMETYK